MIRKYMTFRNLSKKYGFRMQIFFQKKDHGWFGYDENDTKYIGVDIFSKHFYAIMYHEIGHLVAQRSLKFEEKYSKAPDGCLCLAKKSADVVLFEEARASQFANRVMKGEDKGYLRQCFHTYTAEIAKHIVKWPECIPSFIDTVVKCERILK